jgi:glycosyltransferase involved in cell wall biosynthesis
MGTTITAAIICRDEERNIADCLESVAWCDEVLVVDSGSSDRTVELALKHASRVLHHAWAGHAAQRNFAQGQASGDWVIHLDADERCTPELREAVRAAVRADPPFAGFEVRRHTFYLGRWIDHGGWYPDWKLRVVRRGRGRFGGTEPHDRFLPDGPTARLEADLVHYTYRDFADQIGTIQHFSDVVAEDWVKQGRRFSWLRALVHPPAKFLGCYVWKLGFLDGWPGFVIAVASAFYVFAKHVKHGEGIPPV